jgi:WD40 repeat protein/serine/threonine protein kinase
MTTPGVRAVNEALDRLESLFAAALQQPPADRAAYLDQACGDDPAVRQRVEALLRAQAAAGDFLQAPSAAPGATVDEPPVNEAPGVLIGPYKLIEPIGEGGMGTVWMAQQTAPVKRLVAVKLIKAGMDSKAVIARFEAERQALALMDHPNIARVLDGGTTKGEPGGVGPGRPYFVMDLVKGVPITKYCDEHHLTPRQRLELFVPVCQAIQHAHQKGIIHRDLKPSNVLVAPYDAKPVVKVIDFGVAKAAGQQLTDKTLVTGIGALVGTLEYMSPEQAELNNLDIDTRSDIYSLGVLLYELLTGSPPFTRKESEKAGMLEMLRVIREQEPTKPSAKLSTAEGLPTLAANRGTEPAKLTRLVRGELDWIVMKALEKDRNRRYETANSFAMDVQRHLNDEPVHACPPSAWYQFRKFARRHRAAIGSLALLGVTVLAVAAVAGLGVVYSSYQRAESAYQVAQSAFQSEASARQAEADASEQRELFHYYHRIALAHLAWRDNQVAQAEFTLEQCPDRFRHWEWCFVKRLCHAELVRLEDHAASVSSVAFSSDGQRLASGSADRTVIIRDAATGQARLVLRGHTGPVWGVAFSPDGERLASVGASGGPGQPHEVKIWEVATGKEVLSFSGRSGWIQCVVFSPDGQHLATAANAGTEGVVKVWDAASGKEVFSSSAHAHGAYSVTFSPDGEYLATAGDQTIRIWHASTYQESRSFHGHDSGVRGLAFSPDNRQVASAGFDGMVAIWDPTTGRKVLSLRGHTQRVHAVAYSPDGTRLASASADQTVKLWDVADGRELWSYRGHTSEVFSVAFSPDGRRLASSAGKTIKVWDATCNPEARALPGHRGSILGVAFTPDSSRLATVASDKTVRLWDLETGREVRSFPLSLSVFGRVAFSPSGSHIASPAADHTIDVWDGATGQPLLRLGGHKGGVFSTAFSPDGKRLASTGYDNMVKVWDVATGQELLTLRGHTSAVYCAAFSPDGMRLASGGIDTTVRVWDLATGQELLALPGHIERVSSVIFRPDGQQIASASHDGTVKVWDAFRGQELFTLGHDVRLNFLSVAFSPDGQRLASASADGIVKVWDTSNGQNTLSVRIQGGMVRSLEFSPDGRRMVWGSLDGTVKVLDATPLR